MASCFFFFNDTATTEIYTLSLHDALPISTPEAAAFGFVVQVNTPIGFPVPDVIAKVTLAELVVTVLPNDRWITPLNCVANDTPHAPLPCRWVKANCVAAPAVTVHAPLVAL